jgi:putative exporter of polyketide antibiotics
LIAAICALSLLFDRMNLPDDQAFSTGLMGTVALFVLVTTVLMAIWRPGVFTRKK